ncbi:MAG TPA: PadR family transcriptional regulator [Actinomycetota bacterium]|jgi:DNA-binding PadR family transcriptional regulator|nr:PadR family transcriptional regulator [Actinomycetota bacterium]
MDGPPRTTINLLRVLRVFLEDPASERYGLEVGQAAGLRGGSLYPVFGRLEDAGMLVSHWEETDPSEAGRPRRRMYRLTAEGVVYARQAIAEAQQSLAPGQEHAAGWGRTAGFPAPGGASA